MLASDDDNAPLVTGLADHLRSGGHAVVLAGAGLEWPEAGRLAGEAVATGSVDRAVVCCFTGTGVAIAANKVPGARCALCGDVGTAVGARRYNDANVLALGIRQTAVPLAAEILDAFLETGPDDAERAAVARLEAAS